TLDATRCYNPAVASKTLPQAGRSRMHRSAVVVTTLAVVLGATVAHGQMLSGEYKIGLLEPLTGPLAGEGKRHLEGYEIVRDMINERGGVMGKKLVFTVADAPDPTAAASEANRNTSFLPMTPPRSLIMTRT